MVQVYGTRCVRVSVGEVDFLAGSAESIPASDASAEVILSVVAVIFSGHSAKAAEVLRVLAPDASFIFSAWA
jgi:ubiquinone/menaquinone biosynthesis C-methylase UbiE